MSVVASTNARVPTRADAYVEYTRRFFERWLPLYDLFAWTISFAYRSAVRTLDPEAGDAVLDLCTGTGEIALRCAQRGAVVSAVDITGAMLGRARRKATSLPIRFALMDARRLALRENGYPQAMLSFALHDMPRRARIEALDEALRVCRDRLVILDYDLPRSPLLRRFLIGSVSLFETAYFPGFAREGIGPLVRETGREAVLVRRLWPFFSVWTIDPSPNPRELR